MAMTRADVNAFVNAHDRYAMAKSRLFGVEEESRVRVPSVSALVELARCVDSGIKYHADGSMAVRYRGLDFAVPAKRKAVM